MVSYLTSLIQCLHIIVFARQAAAAQSNWRVGQLVKTSSGSIKGHAASDADQVSEYLGIPYAQPPIDDLRFQPPVAFNGTSIITATDFGHACMQPFLSLQGSGKKRQGALAGLGITEAGIALLMNYGSTIPSQDEDCLTLNIWTKPQTGDDKKAVLVWIHGGGYKTGASGIAWYNGQYFADEEDVVLVSFNYRMNIFGFPGSPDATANLGLLDQRLAIEWIRDNIEGFGGDPARITIFGQSAGGSAVDIYSYAWTEDPIVNGFISQSGVARSKDFIDADTASDQWQSVASGAGCSGSTSDTLSCMVDLPATKVLSAIATATTYGPVVDNTLVFSDYATQTPVALPMLVGHTDFEPGLTRALTQFKAAEDVYTEQEQDIWVCPTAERSQASVQIGAPIWRYRYFGAFPNTILTENPPSGAYHTCELPILFGTVPQTVVANTDAENEIATYMRGAWAAFAKDPAQGLVSYGGGWPTYSADGNTLIRLAFNNESGTNLDAGNAYDGSCSADSSTGRSLSASFNKMLYIAAGLVVVAFMYI